MSKTKKTILEQKVQDLVRRKELIKKETQRLVRQYGVKPGSIGEIHLEGAVEAGYWLARGNRPWTQESQREPVLIIPDSVDRSRSVLDLAPCEFHVFIPTPNAEDNGGIYVNRADFVSLLRANKNNPDAIQYLADMLE